MCRVLDECIDVSASLLDFHFSEGVVPSPSKACMERDSPTHQLRHNSRQDTAERSERATSQAIQLPEATPEASTTLQLSSSMAGRRAASCAFAYGEQSTSLLCCFHTGIDQSRYCCAELQQRSQFVCSSAAEVSGQYGGWRPPLLDIAIGQPIATPLGTHRGPTYRTAVVFLSNNDLDDLVLVCGLRSAVRKQL